MTVGFWRQALRCGAAIGVAIAVGAGPATGGPIALGSGLPTLEAVTIEGGPIWSSHLQEGDPGFRESHGIGVLKAHTAEWGDWALYVLAPNSVDRTSLGVGYVTPALDLALGPTRLEFTAAIGLVTGYQEYPLPLLAGHARWVVISTDGWDAGVAVAASPYVAESEATGNNEVGVVFTTPFLSLTRKF